MFRPCLTLKFLLTTPAQQYRLRFCSICYSLNAARLSFQQKLQKMKMKRHSKRGTETAVTGNFKIITHKINSLDGSSIIHSYVDSCRDDSHRHWAVARAARQLLQLPQGSPVHSITEMVWVGWDHLAPTALTWAGTLDRAPQRPIQPVVEHFQGEASPASPGNLSSTSRGTPLAPPPPPVLVLAPPPPPKWLLPPLAAPRRAAPTEPPSAAPHPAAARPAAGRCPRPARTPPGTARAAPRARTAAWGAWAPPSLPFPLRGAHAQAAPPAHPSRPARQGKGAGPRAARGAPPAPGEGAGARREGTPRT